MADLARARRQSVATLNAPTTAIDGDTLQNEVFCTLRAMERHAITGMRVIIEVHPEAINCQMNVYEGSIESLDRKSKDRFQRWGRTKCYNFSTKSRDRESYAYPIHVAAEAGYKELVLFLASAGADVTLEDSAGFLPVDKANGKAKDAFLEMQGLSFDGYERYEGDMNADSERSGEGRVVRKREGYHEKELVLYEGSFKNGEYHGRGVLYHMGRPSALAPAPAAPAAGRAGDGGGAAAAAAAAAAAKGDKESGGEATITTGAAYVGDFYKGFKHGNGTEYNERGFKTYVGRFKYGVRHGHGIIFAMRNSIVGGEQALQEYEGSFVKGKQHGYGVFTPEGGHRYEGKFEQGQMSGAGTYTLPNGDRYEGMFEGNQKCGTGSYYESGGSRVDGEWDSGELMTTREDKKPFVPDPEHLGFVPEDSSDESGDEEVLRGADVVDLKRPIQLGSIIRQSLYTSMSLALKLAADFIDGAGAAIDRRIQNGRLSDRPAAFLSVYAKVLGATREIIGLHKDLTLKQRRQEKELEELVALREAHIRDHGLEGMKIDGILDEKTQACLDSMKIDAMVTERDRVTVAALKADLLSLTNNKYAVDLMAHIGTFAGDG